MSVDGAHAAVLVDVIAAKEQVAHLKRQLPFRVAGRVPDLQTQIADRDGIAFVEINIDLARRHRNFKVLRLDGGKGNDLVSAFQRLDTERMSGHLGLEDLLGTGQSLDVIGVGVRGDNHLAGRQVEVHAANQLDDFLHGIDIADVDEQKLVAAVEEIDVDAQAAAGLVIHLNDSGKQILSRQHDCDPCTKNGN